LISSGERDGKLSYAYFNPDAAINRESRFFEPSA
jgi:hypothetical protein